MKITIIIYTRLFILFPNLITKESYNWWVTRRVWGFRHQISKAKYLKMSVANIGKHSGPFCRRTRALQDFTDAQDGCEIILQPKADFAALRNWLSAWCDWLTMDLTSPFQLRFMYHLKCWTADFPKRHMACINWTPGSAPKVADMTVIKNASWQISLCFPSLHSGFSYGKGLQSSKAWILHVNELPIALPWIP